MSKAAAAIHLLLVISFMACQLTDDSFNQVPLKPCVFITPPFTSKGEWKWMAPSAAALRYTKVSYWNYRQAGAYTIFIKTINKRGNSMQ